MSHSYLILWVDLGENLVNNVSAVCVCVCVCVRTVEHRRDGSSETWGAHSGASEEDIRARLGLCKLRKLAIS